MSLVRFLIILGVGTLLSWGAWALVLFTLDPFTSGAMALILFYVSLWLGGVGLFAISGFFLRHWLERDGVSFRQIGASLRQAVLLASGAVISLGFQAAGALTWWSGALLILAILTVEFFFLAGQAKRPEQPPEPNNLI